MSKPTFSADYDMERDNLREADSIAYENALETNRNLRWQLDESKGLLRCWREIAEVNHGVTPENSQIRRLTDEFLD